MKKWTLPLFLMLAPLAGCVELELRQTIPPAPMAQPMIDEKVETAPKPLVKRSTPVTADQVSDSNAHEMAQALSEEIERSVKGEPEKKD
jgi:hypothetical protein